jgi:hypothetical protein
MEKLERELRVENDSKRKRKGNGEVRELGVRKDSNRMRK